MYLNLLGFTKEVEVQMIRIRLVTSCMFSGVKLSVQLRHDVQICADCYLDGTWSLVGLCWMVKI